MTASKAKYSVFKMINIEANRGTKQLMKFVDTNLLAFKVSASKVHLGKLVNPDLKTFTTRGTKIQFDTKRHLQPKKWR